METGRPNDEVKDRTNQSLATLLAAYGGCARRGCPTVIGADSGVPYTSLADVTITRELSAARHACRTFGDPCTLV